METYVIAEKQNAYSQREGYEVKAASLASAKRIASRKQTFAGTVLTISDTAGNMMAWKDRDGWHEDDEE